MKLAKYVKEQAEHRGIYKTQVLKELAKKSGVSLLTLQGVERGGRLVNYVKAKAVSVATKGAVTVEDLCE